MRRKLTITVDDAVYEGLRRMVGQRKISQFIENLVKPYIADSTLDEGYRAMAQDKVRETEALEWSNALAIDMSDEAR
jgi:predicted CopG family antitoxin